MTTPAELRALADRCEAATGPDRDIDGWVWAHQKAGEPYIVGKEPGPFPAEPIYGERADVMRDIGGKDGADYIGASAYTASIDAAMSLVPEGLSFTLYRHPDESHCDVFTLHPSKGLLGESEQSATPALALTAAALRAHATISEQNP